MRTLTRDELDRILLMHEQWLIGEGEGERADLRGADLRGADLRDVILSYADLRGANLSNAKLSDADLRGANLSNAKLSDADLRGAKLSDAKLSYADLSGADLRGANLRYANLSGADLSGAKGLPPMVCPETGSFIGYKKTQYDYIVELEIPADALRSSAMGHKCRCSHAKVISITDIVGNNANHITARSVYDDDFTYSVGETVKVDNFNTNRWCECASGIHFFMTREEAVSYTFLIKNYI